MKESAARICFVIALIFFILGFFILCYCPGWYALASGFAAVSVWGSNGRKRAWFVVLLVACLVATALQTVAAINEHRAIAERNRRFEHQQSHATNQPGQTTTPAK